MYSIALARYTSLTLVCITGCLRRPTREGSCAHWISVGHGLVVFFFIAGDLLLHNPG